MRNSHRFDLSDYLIHFFRDIDLFGQSAIDMPEHMGWHSLYEGTNLPAMFMLRAALRNGRLWATWSYRGNARTIYGPDPAVCFTDMPIAAFVEASQLRHARGEAMGEVALVFPKNDMRRLGARPVVYGLSQELSVWPSGSDGRPRIFPADVMPPVEQYRYVSDVSSSGQRIDWTHEREWRWPCRNALTQSQDALPVENWSDISGLDFYRERVSGIGAIVKTRAQAEMVVRDMLTLVDSGVANENTFSFVLVTDELHSVQYIQERQQLALVLQEATINLGAYFYKDPQFINQTNNSFAAEVAAVEQHAGPEQYGEFGGCWLWLHDCTTPLARSLLHTGRVFVNSQGRYLARLDEYSDGRSLRQREEMTQTLSRVINEKFGVQCCYFSVLNSDNADEVPFYADVNGSDTYFSNNAWSYR
ncbi:DUF4427 domain-containing protein [Azospirillum sp. B21]|uniref:DUF4427 domain-containing protein n=1 Tax=Azospirillum sp. B21 TaxID=2607496 RepID=UPI0011EBEBF4|nr:DUF4427 domain-containing protein [Azospirillum sp. B21]KAA0579760.1 DUF4427 domain-containing protein [Azospirillum sp. B21]